MAYPLSLSHPRAHLDHRLLSVRQMRAAQPRDHPTSSMHTSLSIVTLLRTFKLSLRRRSLVSAQNSTKRIPCVDHIFSGICLVIVAPVLYILLLRKRRKDPTLPMDYTKTPVTQDSSTFNQNRQRHIPYVSPPPHILPSFIRHSSCSQCIPGHCYSDPGSEICPDCGGYRLRGLDWWIPRTWKIPFA